MAKSKKKGPALFHFCDNEYKCVDIKDKEFALVEWMVNGDIELCPNDVRIGDEVKLLIPLGKGLVEQQEGEGKGCINVDLSTIIDADCGLSWDPETCKLRVDLTKNIAPDTCLEWDAEKCELKLTINPTKVLDDPNTGNNPTYCTDLSQWQEVIKDPETGKLFVPPVREHGCEESRQDVFKGADIAPNNDYINFFPVSSGGWSVDTADGLEITAANGGFEAMIEKTIENPADNCWKRKVTFAFDGGSHVYERAAAPNDWETLILREYSLNGGPFQLIHINATRSDTPEGQLVSVADPTVDQHQTTVHPTDSYNWCNFNTGSGAGTGCLAPGESITVRQRLFFVKWAYTFHKDNRYQVGVTRVICDWEDC